MRFAATAGKDSGILRRLEETQVNNGSYWMKNNTPLADVPDVLQACDHGVVLLTGRSGCGKTRLLRQLQLIRNVKICSIETVVETMVAGIKAEGRHWETDIMELFDGAEVAAIEDLDVNLLGKSYSQESLASVFSRLAETIPVIVTACQAELTIPYFIDAIPEITIIRHTSDGS